jgi:hypothetical protein
MQEDWSALCRSAKDQPVANRIVLARSSFGILVGLLLLVAASSIWLCTRFYRIPKAQRLTEKGKANVWPL